MRLTLIRKYEWETIHTIREELSSLATCKRTIHLHLKSWDENIVTRPGSKSHRIINCESCRHTTTWRVDIQMNGLGRVLGFKEK